MNIQELLKLGGVVVVAVVLSAVFVGGNTTVVNNPAPEFGAVATLDAVDNPNVSIGGVQQKWVKVPFTATSSNVCRIRNPYNSTSTVVAFSASFNSSPAVMATAQVFSISTSSNALWGTSTPAMSGELSVAAGTRPAYIWTGGIASTSQARPHLQGVLPTTGGSTNFLASGEYLVWGIGTSTSAGDLGVYFTGTCTAIFQQL